MKNRLWLASLAMLPVWALADVENDVRCHEIAFSQSVENQDADSFASFIDADGVATDHWGTFNSVWRKQSDISWKIVFDGGNEAAEPPSEEVQAVLTRGDDCE
jgi:hypothetical protein